MSKTIARQVQETIETRCPQTFSLSAGYGIEAGKPVRFPGGVCMKEVRNDMGRVTKAVYQYADDSTLTFTYSPHRGYNINAN